MFTHLCSWGTLSRYIFLLLVITCAFFHCWTPDMLEKGFEYAYLYGEPRNSDPKRYRVTPKCCQVIMSGGWGRWARIHAKVLPGQRSPGAGSGSCVSGGGGASSFRWDVCM